MITDEHTEQERQASSQQEKKEQTEEAPKKDQKAQEELVQFTCSICHLNEACHYLGKTPPSHKKQLSFKEDTFVMRDPFTPRVVPIHSANRSPWSGCNLLIIGGHCAICTITVCVDCSTFYSRRYCLDCAANHIKEFPSDIGAKIQKKINSRT